MQNWVDAYNGLTKDLKTGFMAAADWGLAMSPEALIQSLLGNRRASEYVFSLPPGEFEEHLKALRIQTFVANGDDPGAYQSAGRGFVPVVYLEYDVAFETNVPQKDVLLCLNLLKRSPIPPPRMVIAFLHHKQAHMLAFAIRIMCLTRNDPKVKRIARRRARAVYDCRVGERWVEVHLSKKPIPTAERRMLA